MTMAGILKVTANGTTTSPIVRRRWVLDRILGTPPPKPPPGVEAVEPDIRGATTIRDQLAKHRKVETCAVCHTKIDPPGFRAGKLRRHRRLAGTLPQHRQRRNGHGGRQAYAL